MRVWGFFAIVASVVVGCSLSGVADVEGSDTERGNGPGASASEDEQETDAGGGVTPAPTTNPPKQDASTMPIEAGPTGPLKAFVSSETVTGNLGGLNGADALCNKLAKAANLPGSYVAWVSTAAVNAIDRVKGNGPWQLVNGTEVAKTKADLAKGTLDKRFDKDEKGGTPPAAEDRVWTGTGADGKFKAPDCDAWGATTSDGLVGEAEQTNGGWTSRASEDCTEVNRVYCLQQ